MDLISFFVGVANFALFAVILAFISLICTKIFYPVKKKVEERFNFGWTKSVFSTNFILIFVSIFLVFIYFIIVGAMMAAPRDEALNYDFVETLLLVFFGAVRIIFSALILSMILLFFEFLTSYLVDYQEERKYPKIAKQFIALLVVSAIFLVLLLFFFSWVPFGLFIYIFHGGINPLPL